MNIIKINNHDVTISKSNDGSVIIKSANMKPIIFKKDDIDNELILMDEMMVGGDTPVAASVVKVGEHVDITIYQRAASMTL